MVTILAGTAHAHAAGRIRRRAIPGGSTRATRHATFLKVQPGFPPYFSGSLVPSWGDYDNDGRPDLPLYHNAGNGTFTETPGVRALLNGGNYHGSAWEDYDKDGYQDLVILPYTDSTDVRALLLHNLGDGHFEDVAPWLGMDVPGFGETAVWGDFDGDDWPDLFAPYYAHAYPFHSFMWHNNGDGTFSDVTDTAGVGMRELPFALRPEGATAVDWDGDGDLDLYCASHFFINDGRGHFTDVRAAVGLPEMFDEGAEFVDYDNDGDFDLYLRGVDGPHLWRNDGGHFVDATAGAGLEPMSVFWGDSWEDVDNDGDLDLLAFEGGAPARLLLNQGDGTFLSDTTFLSLDLGVGLAARADFDHDGDVDLVAGVEQRPVLLINQLDQEPGFANSSIRVLVLDRNGYRTEQGAIVRLRRLDADSGPIQSRIVGGGSSYLNHGEYTTRFGVVPGGVYGLSVEFPSGGIIVDASVDPALGRIEPDHLNGATIVVFRDGRVATSPGGVGLPWRLGQPRPNPSHGIVNIDFTMLAAGPSRIDVYDMSGRRVKGLLKGMLGAGAHRCTWTGTDRGGNAVRSGVYFVRFRSAGKTESRKVVLFR